MTTRLFQTMQTGLVPCAVFAMMSIVLCACSSGGSSSSQVGSDEEVRIASFSDLPISGISIHQDGEQVEFISATGNTLTTITLSIGDASLSPSLERSGNELAGTNFRDFFIEALPVQEDAILKETITLNDVTSFDHFANALLLLASLDSDHSLLNGVDLSQLEQSKLEGIAEINLAIPNSRFLSSPSTQILITHLGGSFALNPYEVLSQYYELNQIQVSSALIFGIEKQKDGRVFSSNFRFNIDSNIKTIEHNEILTDGSASALAEESFLWENTAQLNRQDVNAYSEAASLEYSYDNLGRLNTTTRINAQQNSLTAYNYAPSGLLEHIETTVQSNAFTTLTTELLQYEGNQHSSSLITVTNDNPPISQQEAITFDYDSFGNVMREERDFGNDGQIDQITEYQRDKHGNPTQIKVSTRSGISDDVITQSLTTFQYDDMGRVLDVGIDRDANGALDTKTSYKYSEGFLTEFAITQFDTNETIVSETIELFTYKTRENTGVLRNLISPPQLRVPLGYQP